MRWMGEKRLTCRIFMGKSEGKRQLGRPDRRCEDNIKTFMKITNKMQLYRLIYFSLSALHVLGNVFAHHQEH